MTPDDPLQFALPRIFAEGEKRRVGRVRLDATLAWGPGRPGDNRNGPEARVSTCFAKPVLRFTTSAQKAGEQEGRK